MYFPLGNCEFLRWIGQKRRGVSIGLRFFLLRTKKLLADPFSPSGAFSALLYTFFLPRSLRSRSFPLRMVFFCAVRTKASLLVSAEAAAIGGRGKSR